MDRKSEWKTAHFLGCRKAGELEFTQSTKKWGVEMFQDRATNRLLYMCESGSVMLAEVPPGLVTEKGPKWHHALEPKVRAPEQTEFTNAKKFGMEIFKDENTGGLIYITEVGAIAPASTTRSRPPTRKKIAPPKGAVRAGSAGVPWRGGKRFHRQDQAGEPGSVRRPERQRAVLSHGSRIRGNRSVHREVRSQREERDLEERAWPSALRKSGEKFDDAKKFGIEVFEDNRTGNLIFVSETGSIAVLPK